jgi:hypothetical protein
MIAQMTVFFAPCGVVDITVHLPHANQRETWDTRERARGVDQISDLPEPARVLLPIEATSLPEFAVRGRVLPRLVILDQQLERLFRDRVRFHEPLCAAEPHCLSDAGRSDRFQHVCPLLARGG